MPYISIPPPHEPFVDEDGKVSEIWYRYLNENLGRINSVSTINSGTATEISGGTDELFTGIPPGVNRVTVSFGLVEVSTPGGFMVQLGTTAGNQITGYTANSMESSTVGNSFFKSTAGFGVSVDTTAVGRTGLMQIVRNTSNIWVSSHIIGTSTSLASYGYGRVNLGSSEIDRINIVVDSTTNNTFIGGAVNIHWEF